MGVLAKAASLRSNTKFQSTGQCLLRVINGHRRELFEFPLCARKRTCSPPKLMSAKCQKQESASVASTEGQAR